MVRPPIPRTGIVSRRSGATGETAVRILDNLLGPHSENIRRALGKTSNRYQLLAANLANANTPGYARQDADFAVDLIQAERKPTLHGPMLARRGPQAVAQRGGLRADGNGVDPEREVLEMSQTELRYQILTEFTSRYFSGLRNVIREGR